MSNPLWALVPETWHNFCWDHLQRLSISGYPFVGAGCSDKTSATLTTFPKLTELEIKGWHSFHSRLSCPNLRQVSIDIENQIEGPDVQELAEVPKPVGISGGTHSRAPDDATLGPKWLTPFSSNFASAFN
jgi:hypothetical protein